MELSARERNLYFRELVGVTVKGRTGLGFSQTQPDQKIRRESSFT